MTLRLTAPAKVNLFLHVTGRRADGYHLLESLVGFTDFGDVLEFDPADTLTLDTDGPFAAAVGAADNIVLKAARVLRARHGLAAGARMRLHKHLPVAAGLGGGSSDAAAALRGLMQLWNCSGLGDADLAAMIGADVPVCLRAAPAVMRGIGEDVSPAPAFPGCGVVLVNAGRAVSTPDVFRALRPPFTQPFLPLAPSGWRDFAGFIAFLTGTRNDLTAPATALAPAITETLDALTASGAALARMSGSGATCFGLYATEGAAHDAANVIARSHGAWWIKAGRFLEPAS